MSRCCGFVVDARFVVDLLWTCCTAFDLLWICCGFAVQLVVQQIHNKSNKWSLTTLAMCPTDGHAQTRLLTSD